MHHSSSAQTLDSSKLKGGKYKGATAGGPSNMLHGHPHFKNPHFMKMARSGSTGDFAMRKSSAAA